MGYLCTLDLCLVSLIFKVTMARSYVLRSISVIKVFSAISYNYSYSNEFCRSIFHINLIRIATS